jgi:hypothetical protein
LDKQAIITYLNVSYIKSFIFIHAVVVVELEDIFVVDDPFPVALDTIAVVVTLDDIVVVVAFDDIVVVVEFE